MRSLIAPAIAVAAASFAARAQLPEPDCSLSRNRSHASVAPLMHVKGTCQSLRAKFATDAKCATPAGFRRPKAAEITPAVVKNANGWLKSTPSDVLWLSKDIDLKLRGAMKSYRFRTEYHCHNPGERGPQGWHKGVTVYIKK